MFPSPILLRSRRPDRVDTTRATPMTRRGYDKIFSDDRVRRSCGYDKIFPDTGNATSSPSLCFVCRPPSCASVNPEGRDPRPPDPVDPEARNAKVRHDDDPSMTTSTTSTTSTTPTPDERLHRLLRLRPEDDGFRIRRFLDPMCDPNPKPYIPYISVSYKIMHH